MHGLTLVEDHGIWQVRRQNTIQKIQEVSVFMASVKTQDVNEFAKIYRDRICYRSVYIIPDVQVKGNTIYDEVPHQQQLLKFIKALNQLPRSKALLKHVLSQSIKAMMKL